MTRYSDDESQSDSQSDQLSSLQSSLLNSSFSSREGSISGSLKGPLTGVVQQKVNSIMQGIRPPSPGRVPTNNQPIRAQHPAQVPMMHMQPQSPTGSSSGTATPPYVPSMGTPPYRLPPPPPAASVTPLSPQQQPNYMYQGPGGPLMRPPSPAIAQTVATRMPGPGVIQTVHSQRQGLPGQMSRYSNPMSYRAPAAYTGQKPSSPVTSTPMVPPRPKQGEGSLQQQEYPGSGGISGGGQSMMEQHHSSDVNSPANLQQASLKFYGSPESGAGGGYSVASTTTPGSPAGSVSSMSGPGASVRVSISSLVQNKGGGSPGSRGGYNTQHTSTAQVQGRFQPMNRAPYPSSTGGGNLYHSSSLESIQSLQSFHSYPGVYSSVPQSPPVHGNAVAYGQGLNSSSQGSNREWYQSDSETSVYASGEDTAQYKMMNMDKYKLPSQQPIQSQYAVSHMQTGGSSIHHRLPPTEISHDDSWYRTTTDEEGEFSQPPRTSMPNGPQYTPQPGQATRQVIANQEYSSGVYPQSKPAKPPVSLNGGQQVQNSKWDTSHGQSHSGLSSSLQAQGHPVYRKDIPPTQQPQQLPRHHGPPQSQQNSFYQPKTMSSIPVTKSDKNTAVKPPPQYPGPSYNQAPATNRPASLQTNSPVSQNPHSSASVTTSVPQSGLNNGNSNTSTQKTAVSGDISSASTPKTIPKSEPYSTYSTNNTPLNKAIPGSYSAQNTQNSMQRPVSEAYATHNPSLSQSSHPPLPPRSKPPPPYPSAGSSQEGAFNTNGLSSSSGNGDLSKEGGESDHSGVDSLNNKWMSTKSQVKAEQQTRMGFLFRDMNLKASQC